MGESIDLSNSSSPDIKPETKINLNAIRKTDEFIVSILDTASQVALYKFDSMSQAWAKTDVEGTLFVCRRSTHPMFSLFIMNRLSRDNVREPVTKEMEFKWQEPFLLYRNTAMDILGIWFYDSSEGKRIGKHVDSLIKSVVPKPRNNEKPQHQGNILQNLLMSAQENKSRTVVTSPKPEAEEKPVDILSMLSKASTVQSTVLPRPFQCPEQAAVQNKPVRNGVNSRKTPSPRPTPQPAQKQSPLTVAIKDISEYEQQKQKSLQQQQQMFHTKHSEELQSLLNNPTSPKPVNKGRSNTFHAGIHHAATLDSQSPTLQNGSSNNNMSVSTAALTLSGVGPPTIKSVITRKTSAPADSSKTNAQRKLFQKENAQSSPQAQNTPLKGSEGLSPAAGNNNGVSTSLLSPLAFQTSITANKQQQQTTTPISQAPARQLPQEQPKINPLTKEQVQQAMMYLMKNDSDFLSKLHEAYLLSLNESLAALSTT